MKIHIVQKGDTLWKIAQKYGVQFEELKKINSQLSNPDMIMPGMKIKIPGTSTAKQTQMMPSNTKINVGSKKEAPISGTTVSPVKEVPKQVAVTPMNVAPLPTQQVPNIHKEQPMTVKEQPMVQPMPVMPQPIIPEVDINNYYIANMSNMMVQKPQPKEQPKEYPKEQPIVLKPEESPESMESNVQQPMHSYPVMVDNCVPFTPIMPGPGFCQPMYPTMYQQPVYGPGPVQMQMHQPYYGEESTSMFEPQMSSWHYGAYMPMMQHQSMMPQYGHMYYEPGIVIPQVPLVSAHGLHHHHNESTSHYVSESSSHMQAPYDQYQSAMPEQVMEEEDCGCGAPKMPKTMDQSMNEGQHVQQFMSFQPQLATSNQVQMDPTHMSESHAEMNDSQMSGSQPNMYQSQMSGSQPGMYQPQMSGGQPGMHQPQMSGSQPGMYYQPQMSGGQPGMYQPQMSGGQPGMYQPQMSGGQPGMYQPQMSGGQPGMYQPQMSGGQPGMYQPQMSGGQPGMAQQQMNPNQPGSMMPQMRGNQPFIPMGNVPFYGQDENIPDIGKLSSYSEAFELPRFADESNE